MRVQDLKTLNSDVRELFNEWWIDSMEPRKGLVAKRMNMSYDTLKHFCVGRDISYPKLYSITQFLEKQGYKLKEHA